MISKLVLEDGSKKVYSTNDYRIKQIETGVVFDSPVFDSPESNYTYEETNTKSFQLSNEV